MQYIIVMPAYNEAEGIGQTLESLGQQTLLPKELVVVNDGSTDETAAIVQAFAAQHPWVRLINHQKGESRHAPGGKIVRAFYVGYNTITTAYDFVVKLDADLDLPANYFEKVSKIFTNDPKIGIAGGINVVERDGKWVIENFADDDHVRGAFKAYRKACFQDIGGLKESVGWDTVDELLAIYHGWKIKTDLSLQIKHRRERGTMTGFIKVMLKIGRAMFRMRYGFLVTFFSAIKAGMVNRPFVLTGIGVLRGYFRAWLDKDSYIVSPEEGRFIRQYRWQRLGKKY